MKALAISVAMFAAFSGCGSCGSPEEVPTTGSTTPQEAQDAGPPVQPPIAPTPEQPSAVEEEDCFVIMDATPDYGPAPLEVQFSAEVDCTGGDPSYAWNFGDGSPVSNEPDPRHVYQKPGEYTAAVVITGPRGGTDEDELDILVEE